MSEEEENRGIIRIDPLVRQNSGVRVGDKIGRKEILQIHSRGMPFEGKPEEREKLLDELSSLTHGFVGADLAALSREAAMKALRRRLWGHSVLPS